MCYLSIRQQPLNERPLSSSFKCIMLGDSLNIYYIAQTGCKWVTVQYVLLFSWIINDNIMLHM